MIVIYDFIAIFVSGKDYTVNTNFTFLKLFFF